MFRHVTFFVPSSPRLYDGRAAAWGACAKYFYTIAEADPARGDPPDDSFFLNVDNISVRSVSDRQIPEPATAVLRLGGLVAASLSRRRPRAT
jgi:hypothetical protein